MTKLEKLCIKWLNENYSHMVPFIIKEYPDYIFHMKDGKCILQHNKRNGYVYVNYREIWSFFERVFSMSNQQIKDITKIWVEEHYKKGVTSTVAEKQHFGCLVEEHYKKGVTSTLKLLFDHIRLVEEHYKKGVTSTEGFDTMVHLTVEEHYQKIQTTNNQNEFYFDRDVEELYNQHTNG